MEIRNFVRPNLTIADNSSNSSAAHHLLQRFVVIPRVSSDSIEYLQQLSREQVFLRNLLFYAVAMSAFVTISLATSLAVTYLYRALKCGKGIRALKARMQRRAVLSALNKINIENWPPESRHFVNNESCVICLESFLRDNPVRKLHCDHVFHVNCIDTWLVSNKASCPICKTKLVGSRSKRTKHENMSEAAEGERAEISIMLPISTTDDAEDQLAFENGTTTSEEANPDKTLSVGVEPTSGSTVVSVSMC